jgi:hypothetical protein
MVRLRNSAERKYRSEWKDVPEGREGGQRERMTQKSNRGKAAAERSRERAAKGMQEWE